MIELRGLREGVRTHRRARRDRSQRACGRDPRHRRSLRRRQVDAHPRLTGLERPTSGTVSIDGTDLTEQTGAGPRQARRNIGMVFQHVNLLDSRTALDNVAHPAADRRCRQGRTSGEGPGAPRVRRPRRPPRQPSRALSGGQRQRVGIARALAAEPKVLLCDEPTSALDASTTEQILGLIRSLRDRLGITVLIITHEMSVVREICDSVTLLADGRVAKTGKLAEVIAEPGSSLAKDLVPLPPVSLGDGESGIVEVALAGTTPPRVLTCAGGVDIGADAILAGAVETVEDRQVGRIRFSVSGPVQAKELIAAFDTAGIHAEEVAAK